MSRRDKGGEEYAGAKSVGIEVASHDHHRVQILSRGLKTTRESIVKVSLPRVKFLEAEVPDVTLRPPKNRGGRPRKKPA